MKIWTDVGSYFGGEAMARLREGLKGHEALFGADASGLESAEIAFGQPDPAVSLSNPSLRWIEVSSAGYTRYDTEPFRQALRSRGAVFTNASSIYADPCAEHCLAMMLAVSRRLLPAQAVQLGDRSWPQLELRADSRLLTGATVVLLGFGSIGRRLAELLAPFSGKVYAVRRQVRSEPGVHVVPEESLTKVLGEADHVVNVLPQNESTVGYVNARRIGCFKRGARFYNVGRGATVDQEALLEGLQSGRVGAAYLDVTSPEPLPPSHPLWSAPNCYITPHSAGGRGDDDVQIVRHFLENLQAFESGASLTDRIL